MRFFFFILADRFAILLDAHLSSPIPAYNQK
jgi:hypothetical protein